MAKALHTYRADYDGQVFAYRTTRTLTHAVLARGNFHAMLEQAKNEAHRKFGQRERNMREINPATRSFNWDPDLLAEWAFTSSLTPQQHLQYEFYVERARVYGLFSADQYCGYYKAVSWHKTEAMAHASMRSAMNSGAYDGGHVLVVPVIQID